MELIGTRHYGVAVDEPFVINVADAPAIGAPRGATFIKLEPDGVTWPDTGVNVQVMQPGQPNGRYHSDPVQEDFLVLYGECIAIVEGKEHALRRWDFLHCPAGCEHIFVGAGDAPCAVLMIGSRREDACHYPVNETAARYDASVSRETDDPAEAYADWRASGPGCPGSEPVAVRVTPRVERTGIEPVTPSLQSWCSPS
jgi:uncharacterized cupin superfamily protein